MGRTNARKDSASWEALERRGEALRFASEFWGCREARKVTFNTHYTATAETFQCEVTGNWITYCTDWQGKSIIPEVWSEDEYTAKLAHMAAVFAAARAAQAYRTPGGVKK